MKHKLAVIIVLAALCVAFYPSAGWTQDTPVDTPVDTTLIKTFGGVLYEYSIKGPTHGEAWGHFLFGMQTQPMGNLWIGIQAMSAGVNSQGGWGPSLYWIHEILGNDHTKLSLVGDFGYLSELVYDPETAELSWGPKGGLGGVLSFADESHLAFGLMGYPDAILGGNAIKTITAGGGLFITEPGQKLKGLGKGLIDLVDRII